MKRIRMALAVLIAAVLLSSLALISQAEPAAEGEWQADITKLMNPGDVPSTTEITYENTYEDGVEVDTHDVACEINVNGVNYGCEFRFELVGEPVSDWDALQSWLGGIVTDAARTAGSDSESLAKAVDVAIATARSYAAPGADGSLSEWAADGFKVKLIRVSTPFYPELSEGKNGAATQRLQQRLIELGFLDGASDGYYGEQTRSAVEAVENYVRALEQDLIDARPESTTAAMAEPTAAPTAEPEALYAFSEHTLNLRPRDAVAEAAVQPTAPPMEVAADQIRLAPVTRVDGIADALLQAYLYSDAYRSARRELRYGDSGDDVIRLQRRLASLGCSTEPADGNFGSNTARSVRIFQYYNGIEQTGVADVATQSRIFSGSAQAPDNSMLSAGSTGESVERLQTRLRELGFTTVSTDGDYGAATQTAVENLQSYMRDIEAARLHADNPTIAPDADLSDQLRVVVNGVADPILLDDFYSLSFPMVPAQMSSGDSGSDVMRLQRRLSGLEYLYTAPDGNFGEQTATAVTAFQRRNKLPETGVADIATMQVLFSGNALKALKPYELRVSIDDQRVYAYAPDADGNYTELVRTMKCSTGRNATPTPKGTYKASTCPGARWHYFKKFSCWAQYAYYIEGDIMFHSVLYNQKGGPVTQSSVNNLGRKASHGCVRLSVEDAKWIYNNCPQHTTVVVY